MSLPTRGAVRTFSWPSHTLLPSAVLLVPVSYAASPTEFWCING
jgi:hypothetical protein